MRGQRLDRTLVERGLVTSRSRAAQLIASGDVEVDGTTVTKAAYSVSQAQRITIRRQDPWVSRAAHKLLGALEAFPQITVESKRCLDAGASTGGFTQVLLSQGAAKVVAADVGHHQLAPELRADPRVLNHEGLNLRYVNPGQLGDPFELIVADLSFISLRLLVAPLASQAAPGADLVLMVKPQFEVGRDRLSRTGVVTNPQQRREAVVAVIEAAARVGLWLRQAARSPLTGQDGNAEFFLHLVTSPAEGTGNPSSSQAVSDKVEEIEFGDENDDRASRGPRP